MSQRPSLPPPRSAPPVSFNLSQLVEAERATTHEHQILLVAQPVLSEFPRDLLVRLAKEIQNGTLTIQVLWNRINVLLRGEVHTLAERPRSLAPGQ